MSSPEKPEQLQGSKLIDYLVKAYCKYYKNASLIEKDRINIPKALMDKPNRCLGNEEELVPLLKSACPDMEKLSEPAILVLSGSAKRCTILLRSLSSLRSSFLIAKLFAKHIRLADQINFLKSHKTPLAVATPNRIIQLAEEGPLDLEKLRLIVIDMKRNANRRNIFDVRETNEALFRLLMHNSLNNNLRSGLTKLVLF